MEAATILFNNMALQNDIAFKYPAEGCYARAHLMVQRLQDLGASPSKVLRVSLCG
ncbi:MAG: protein-glutamine glutaminase family protein [Proteobacteria bacterium]|nr:protein-glutamine glutaminase family protein [Pseudomonadota bacterium]